MPSRTAYNPDTKIPAAIRSANALPLITDGDPVRTFSRWELDELRADLLSSTLDTLRRDKLVALIDQNEAAKDYRTAIAGALDAADLETLAGKVETASDELSAELKPGKFAEGIAELLTDNPKASPGELTALFTEFVDDQLVELRKSVAEALEPISTGVENTRAALRVLDPNV